MSGRDERPIDIRNAFVKGRIHYADILSYGLDDTEVTENPDEVTCPMCLAIMEEREIE